MSTLSSIKNSDLTKYLRFERRCTMLHEVQYFVDNLGVVFPKWEERCEELKPYAEYIWKHACLPKVGPQFPEIEWEGSIDNIGECGPILKLRDIEENNGALRVKTKKERERDENGSAGSDRRKRVCM